MERSVITVRLGFSEANVSKIKKYRIVTVTSNLDPTKGAARAATAAMWQLRTDLYKLGRSVPLKIDDVTVVWLPLAALATLIIFLTPGHLDAWNQN